MAKAKAKPVENKDFDKDSEQVFQVIQTFVKKYGQTVEIPEDALPEGVEFPQFVAAGTMNHLLALIKNGAPVKEDKNDLNYIG